MTYRIILPTLAAVLWALPAAAAQEVATAAELQALRAEIQTLKKTYSAHIAALEEKLAQVATTASQAASAPVVAAIPPSASSNVVVVNQPPATAAPHVRGNSFNPSIGVILNGQFNAFSADEGELAGFALGEEGERAPEGFALDHTEINFAANVDDKFTASVTTAVDQHDGGTELVLEEAFIQTQPGIGLPDGLTLKAGRAFWSLGYLNEHHTHADDFADRPLPYRAFLNDGFNDDGLEISYLLPTEVYAEIGAGLFRGESFPFGGASGSGFNAWSAFARVGGDVGFDQSWRLGAYVLSGKAGSREGNEGTVTFAGNTDLFVADARYTWAPTSNPAAQEVTFQAEHFWRDEGGIYEDTAAATGAVAADDITRGWYAQTVYKFAPQWRLGARYSRLQAPNIPAGLVGSALDAGGHAPKSYTTMLDWTNSEFSRIRLQYNREVATAEKADHQLTLQYVVSLGAHGAHRY